MITSFKTSFFLSATAALLVACGGGGDAAAPVANTIIYDFDAAYTKAFTTGSTSNGTAVDGADIYTMSTSVTPAADEVFEGVLRRKAVQSVTLKKNGAVLTATNVQNYFGVNPFTPHGARYSNGTYALSSNVGNLPKAAQVGQGGPLGISTTYTDSTKTSVVESVEATWTLEADTVTTAYACTNVIIRNSTGAVAGSGSSCSKIDTGGSVVGMRYTLSVSGKTLVFK